LPASAVDVIGLAFEHTKQQLLKPFRLNQWGKLAFVGLLAGELTSGGCNFGGLNVPSRNPDATKRLLDMPTLPHIDPAVYAGLIAFLIIFAFVFMVLFLYVNSVMRFVLFDSVIAKNCEIGKGWSRRHGIGLGYFVWQILLFLITMAGMIIVVGVPLAFAMAAGWLKQSSAHMAPLILGGIAVFFVAAAFVVTIAVVHVLSKDFVVPLMALEGVSAIEGWRRLLPMLRAEKGQYAGYLLLKIVMALGTAVAVGIVATIVVLVTLIPLGGLGAVAILMGKAGGLHWDLYTVTLAALASIGFLGIILYLVSLVSVPAIVFFPAYSIYFFAARYPKLAGVLNPSAPLPPAPPQPQFGPVG
jgi:hypothetical protein